MPIALDVYTRIIAAKLYIDGHFQEPIDLEIISREACISRFHFHRLFTRIYNKTPHQYLTQKRIELARELLAGEQLTVGEICYSVGFESTGSFSDLFKKEIGLGPRLYRNIAWLKKQEAKINPVRFIPHCFIDSFRPGQEKASFEK
jgi:AraC-like DNA-binding protein